MTSLLRHRLPLLGAAATLAAVAVWLLQPAALARLDGIVFDLHLRSASPLPRSGEVAIVEIDEASLQKFGQWPWPRAVVAELLDKMRSAGASVIVIDAVFAEPEHRLGPPLLSPTVASSPALARGAAPGDANLGSLSGDSRLARSILPARVVLGHYFRFDHQPGSPDCQLHPVSVSTAFRLEPKAEIFPQAKSITCSIVQLASVASGSGFLNASPDPDGVLRRVPLVVGYQERAYPSLALAAVLLHRQLRTAHLRQQDDRSEWLTVGDKAVPVGERGTLLLRFPDYREGIPRLSASKVTADSVEIKGRIVLFGRNAVGLQDQVTTPLGPEVPGTEIHVAAIENLLLGSAFQRPANARLTEFLLVLLGGFISTWLLVRFRPLTGGVTTSALLVLLWFGTARFLDSSGVFVSPALPLAVVLGNIAVLGIVSLSIQNRRAEQGETQAEAARQFMVSTVTSLAAVRDTETAEHLSRLQHFVWILCVALRSHPRFQPVLTENRITLIAELVPIHDIGKLGVPREILSKPGRLTPEEFEEVKKHVAFGQEVLERARASAILLDDEVFQIAHNIVCHHHERWDGTGYPLGLQGERISAEGRIVALLDVYDALVHERVYKRAMSHEEALDIIRQGRGTHFDPAVVDAFLRVEQTVKRSAAQQHPASNPSPGSPR